VKALWAAIDVGTNSVRLLVAHIQDGIVSPLVRKMAITRLGEGMYLDGWLKPAAISRTTDAVSSFVLEAKNLGVAGIAIVATSAAREADNKAELSHSIEQATGVTLEILSGNYEAELSFWGATSALCLSNYPVVLDIGGGSTEFVFQDTSGDLASQSNKIGAVRCTELGMGYPEIRELLEPSLKRLAARSDLNLVGVGGTIASLAAMEQGLAAYDPKRVHGFVLRLKEIKSWRQRLAGMPLEERQKISGLQPARADIIPAGVTILEAVMDSLQVKHITVSDSDILEGIILRLAGFFKTPWPDVASSIIPSGGSP